MAWKIPKIWEGGTAWIIGCGTSLLFEFGIPFGLARKVINGELPLSEYSPYLAPIHDKHVIGVNHAFLIGNWIDVFYFSDKEMYIQSDMDTRIAEFEGLRITNNPDIGNDREFLESADIKYVRRSTKKAWGLSPEKDAVCFNANSGMSAIDLAYHFGAKRIILLGMDMTCTELGSHIHSMGTKLSKGQDPTKSFKRHMRSAWDIYKDAQEKEIEILNASAVSKIPYFPKVKAKDYF